MILSDAEIRVTQARHPTDNDPMDFAHAIIAATLDKLSAGVSVEPVAWFNTPVNPTVGAIAYEHEKHGIKSGTPLYTTTAIAAAHQAGRKSVHDSCVDAWKGEFVAAARFAALEEAAKVVEADAVKNPITAYQLQYNLSLQHTAKDIRALKGTP